MSLTHGGFGLEPPGGAAPAVTVPDVYTAVAGERQTGSVLAGSELLLP